MSEESPLKKDNEVSEVEMIFKEIERGKLKDGKDYIRVVLREKEGMRELRFFTGTLEANAILNAHKDIVSPRPLIHELFKNILLQWDIRIVKIVITRFIENIFYSAIVMEHGERWKRIDARPSDAIALALRFGSPICIKKNLLAEHGTDGGPSHEELNAMLLYYEINLDPLPPDLKDSKDEP